MTKVAFGGLASDLPARFSEMVSLLDKFERWWIINVEIDRELDVGEDVIPGPIAGLQLMMRVALGPEEHVL